MYKKQLLKSFPGKCLLLFSIGLCLSFISFAQETRTITGTVVDSMDTAPLQGVSVFVQGTSKVTTTNAQGEYAISVTPNATLIFRYIGYLDKQITLGNQLIVNVSLSSSYQGLEEVVVVAFGTQKKTSLTSAVSALRGKEIVSIPVANLSNSLGGRLPGVIFKQGKGEPGLDGSNIFIRGISSTGANQPLLIVDGIPRSFQQLDPNTIESFTVLKDAAAAAPYGVAGANGVILVTTKRGKTGAPSLTYNGYIGFQNPTILPDYATGYQYATLRNAAAKNDGRPLPYSEDALSKFKDGSDPDRYPPTTDTYDRLITRNAVITSHNIELSGGADRIKYYAGLGYLDQDGMWPATNYNRYNLVVNLDVEATKTTKISVNLNGRAEKATSPAIGSSRLFELIGWVHPGIGPLVFSNGMSGSYVMGNMFKSGYFNNKTSALYSQISVEQKLPFIPGLNIKGTIAYDPTIIMTKIWTLPNHMASINTNTTPYVITDGIFGQTKPSLDQNFNQSHQLTYQSSLNYVRTFGKNNIGALALLEARGGESMNLGANRRNYNLTIDEINMGSSSLNDISVRGLSSADRQIGLVYRATYNYASKYLLEASGRYDGSYYFAPGKQYGFFPAFSVGWLLSEENFIKQNLPWIDDLKIRGSYGEVGALAGSTFQYLPAYNVSGPGYVFGGEATQIVSERSEPNLNITWERAKKTDVGLEATLWKGLLHFEADYFYENRTNMLVNPDVIVPSEYGIGLSQVNAGIMKNQGVEFAVSSFYRVSKDLEVSLGGNFTYAKNTLLQVFESPVTYNNPNRRLTGKPLGTQFGFKALGLFQLSDFNGDGTIKNGIATQPWGMVKPGDIRYDDIDGDGRINDNDLTAIGDPVAAPRIVYGILPHIGYKGFTLDLLFQGAAKSNFYQNNGAIWPFWNGMNAYVKNLDYWTPENPNAKNPRITTAQPLNNTQTSSFWLADASYLRLKSATLAYSIPSVIIQKIGIQKGQIFISGQNIITWTDMIDFDPEIIPTAGGWSPNSGWNYPQQKVFSIGLNVTL